MIRRPTPRAILYAWHTAALAGEADPITNEPRCGYFKRRLVRQGPFVPCEIKMVQEICPTTGELLSDEYLDCLVNGIRHDVDDEWLFLAKLPITEAEFNYLTGLRQWSAWHAPADPAANPKQPIDWLRVAPPVFTREPA